MTIGGAPAPPCFCAQIPRLVTDLKRSLRLMDGLAMVVGIMVGSGIFRTPGLVASQLGRPWLTLVAWLLGGVASAWGVLAMPATVLTAMAFAAPLTAFAATQSTDLSFPMIIRLIVIIAVVVWLLRVFGLMPWLNNLFHTTTAPPPR